MDMGEYLADGFHVHACLGKICIISYQDLWQSALLVVITDNHPLDKPIGDAVYNLAPIEVVLLQNRSRTYLSYNQTCGSGQNPHNGNTP